MRNQLLAALVGWIVACILSLAATIELGLSVAPSFLVGCVCGFVCVTVAMRAAA